MLKFCFLKNLTLALSLLTAICTFARPVFADPTLKVLDPPPVARDKTVYDTPIALRIEGSKLLAQNHALQELAEHIGGILKGGVVVTTSGTESGKLTAQLEYDAFQQRIHEITGIFSEFRFIFPGLTAAFVAGFFLAEFDSSSPQSKLELVTQGMVRTMPITYVAKLIAFSLENEFKFKKQFWNRLEHILEGTRIKIPRFGKNRWLKKQLEARYSRALCNVILRPTMDSVDSIQ